MLRIFFPTYLGVQFYLYIVAIVVETWETSTLVTYCTYMDCQETLLTFPSNELGQLTCLSYRSMFGLWKAAKPLLFPTLRAERVRFIEHERQQGKANSHLKEVSVINSLGFYIHQVPVLLPLPVLCIQLPQKCY